MTAEAQSLVEWVNSFGVGECHSLKDLSSGALLFKCMRNVLPDLATETGREWDRLLQVLAEFCRCSLEQSLSRELIEAGDEEHLARAVVMLLCLAVQRKPNDDVIAKITTLPYEAQHDIMYFIEETLAKMNSNALSSGLFTSGVGDVVPKLSGRTSPDMVEDEAMEDEEGVQTADAGGCGQAELVSTPQPTPNRLSRTGLFACPSSVPRLVSRHRINQASSYYRGLESPAALQWMKQPIPRGDGARTGQTGNSEEQPEEVLRLKHKVRVLERSLANEQTLSQEMHAALCQKEREIQEMEERLAKTRDMAEKARELADVQDELQTMAEALERSEKSFLRLQRECEEQRTSQGQELGEKAAEIESLKTENSQLKELLEKAVGEGLEQKSEVKRLQLSGETAAIAFQAKQRECESLLELSREHSGDIRELKQRSLSLQKQLVDLQDTSAEREKSLTNENHALSLKLLQAQEQLDALGKKQRGLERECESAKQQAAVAEAGSISLLGQYQTAVGELEGLRTGYNMTQGELEEVRGEGEALQTQLRGKDKELVRVSEELSMLRKTSQEELEEAWGQRETFKTQLVEKETELERVCAELAELRRGFEAKEECAREETGCLQTQLGEKEVELGGLCKELTETKKAFEVAWEENERLQTQLGEKETELGGLWEKFTQLKKTLEETQEEVRQEKECLQNQLVKKEEELGGLCNQLCEVRRQAEEKAREMEGQLEKRGRELKELQETSTEQINTLEELLTEAHQKLKSLTERYTTEAEEMAAVKASLEEDLSRAHSELRETRRELAEKEKEQGERERELETGRKQLAAVERELERVGGEVEGLRGEKTRLEEEKGRSEATLEEMTAWVEVKEARWEAEKAALENRTVELSCKVESLTSRTHSLEAREERREKEQGEERNTWGVQRTLLEGRVASLTGELESVSAKSREREREVEELKSVAEKAQSLADSLQAELSGKRLAVEALEQTAETKREEWRVQREEGEERERNLLASLETAQRKLGETTEERERARAELEHLKMESKHSLARIEAEYQNAVAEKQQTHEAYSSQLRSLEEANAALQRQQSEASAENALIQGKQSELYREMTALQATKSEAMDLVRRYEGMFNEERDKRQADRETMRKMRAQGVSESRTATAEADLLRGQLSAEKRAAARLGAENRSLQAQISYLENKLRDTERAARAHNTFTSQPQNTRPSYSSRSDTLVTQPHHSTTTFKKNELDISRISSDILVSNPSSSHHLSSRDETAETTFNDSVFSAPTYQSTVVKPPPMQSIHPPQNTIGRGVGGGGEDDQYRISQLKARNRKVLPHLKSSYAVELQEKKSDPCLLGEQTRRLQLARKRAVGNNTSVRVTSDSASVLEESRKRTSGARKLAGDLSSSGSPASSRRRISDPLTPRKSSVSSLQSTDGDTLMYDPRRATIDASYNLRGCLKDENRPEIDGQDEILTTSIFEVNFSPPKQAAKRTAELPERLRQRLAKPEKKQEKPVSAAPPSASGIGVRKVGRPTKPHAGKKAALRAKN